MWGEGVEGKPRAWVGGMMDNNKHGMLLSHCYHDGQAVSGAQWRSQSLLAHVVSPPHHTHGLDRRGLLDIV